MNLRKCIIIALIAGVLMSLFFAFLAFMISHSLEKALFCGIGGFIGSSVTAFMQSAFSKSSKK